MAEGYWHERSDFIITHNSTSISAWKNRLCSAVHQLGHVSWRAKRNVALSLQSLGLAEICFLKDSWRAKRKFSGFTTKTEWGITAFLIKLNGAAGTIFQARGFICRNRSLIRAVAINQHAVSECSTRPESLEGRAAPGPWNERTVQGESLRVHRGSLRTFPFRSLNHSIHSFFFFPEFSTEDLESFFFKHSNIFDFKYL